MIRLSLPILSRLARSLLTRSLLALSLLTLPLVPQALAAPAVKPFEARYHLSLEGWPNADLTHRLEPDEEGFRATLHASVKIATGYEFARFRLDERGEAAPWHFYSRYRLFGFGDEYRLERERLEALPDRQSALFNLSLRAFDAPACRGHQAAPCQLDYQDHRGRERTLVWRVIDDPTMPVPEGRFQTRHVEARLEDRPKRRLHFYFSPDTPGLLVQLDYFQDQTLAGRLQLTDLHPEGSTDDRRPAH